eukprot:2007354-Rhodomonas_salina.3
MMYSASGRHSLHCCSSWRKTPLEVPSVELTSECPSGQLTSVYVPSSSCTHSPARGPSEAGQLIGSEASAQLPASRQVAPTGHRLHERSLPLTPSRREGRAVCAICKGGCSNQRPVGVDRAGCAGLGRDAVLVLAWPARRAQVAGVLAALLPKTAGLALLQLDCEIVQAVMRWAALKHIMIASGRPLCAIRHHLHLRCPVADQPGRAVLTQVCVGMQDVLPC